MMLKISRHIVQIHSSGGTDCQSAYTGPHPDFIDFELYNLAQLIYGFRFMNILVWWFRAQIH